MAFTTPNVFVPNTLVQSTPVNANFTAIENYINTTLETAAAHASDIALLPKGKVGYAQITANQSGITTVVDVSGLSVTFTALASRYYRITGMFNSGIASTVVDDTAAVRITDSVPNTLAESNALCRPANVSAFMVVQCVLQPGAGSKTYKLRVLRAAGTGSLTVAASATSPSFILVEDIGL